MMDLLCQAADLDCGPHRYDTSALVGAKPATKVAVLFGADGQSWPQVCSLFGELPQ